MSNENVEHSSSAELDTVDNANIDNLENEEVIDNLETEENSEEELSEEDNEEDSEEDEASQDENSSKKKNDPEKRIKKLTWEKHEYARKAAALEVQLAALQSQSQIQDTYSNDEGVPMPHDYEYGEQDANYVRDLTRWEYNQEVKQEQIQQQHAIRQSELQSKVDNFFEKVRETFDEPTKGLNNFLKYTFPIDFAEIIAESDISPKIADYLGNNPADFQRIVNMPVHLQGYAVAQIEAKIKNTPKTIPQSKAPKPPQQTIRGVGGKFAVSPDTDDFEAFKKQYFTS